ncbi:MULTISPECIES: MarR family winged helix-turn-helix transcriptional regulator [Rhodococcus]|uniref:MarR family transcriptional regulator n=1 Tax=Rhodococcus oxybenzonivorans TaxID=1990687 RepID=A0AAE4UWN4_9NOCA|nr:MULTISPECIES: MarR family transcriptional regulator [Rhodococcus]MDV7244700.1 MarR family transcriptional regulator [Rhodococcus oxybenzonivorans]MDV7264070.1 MarR family transcriptional regulator [Rhodococcus oxybenzonivorans]MDV7275801.1 MarR family transcriptional regulator [Rhodococcus oxybenzonivorans]MDV7332578.1 MarR family transcriptional regulator [Rhodococcus oxybenzonivorans]MDV7346374.1 MarR family transcriptional regulator [Rhodococcus oxybenzonivorans]
MNLDESAQTVHKLRALAVELNLLGAEFAQLHGLHTTDLRALISILDAGRADIAATPGWLGDRLGINSASVTALLDRMEKAGLVRRTPDAEDRRRSRITVTATAMNLGETFFGPLINRTTTILEGFEPSERQTISRFLDGMNAAVAVERQVAVHPTEDSVSRSRTRRAGEPT